MAQPDNSPIDLHDYLTRYPQFLECRESGHPWQREQRQWRVEGTGAATTYEKTVVCPQCSTRRTKVRDVHFRFVRMRYDYPEGYQAPGLRMSRADIEQWDIETFTLGHHTSGNGHGGDGAAPKSGGGKKRGRAPARSAGRR